MAKISKIANLAILEIAKIAFKNDNFGIFVDFIRQKQLTERPKIVDFQNSKFPILKTDDFPKKSTITA